MKMYVWTPAGHGQLSFMVCAETVVAAVTVVNAQVELVRHDRGEYPVRGWGTDYYTMGAYEPGEVFEHEND